MRVNLRCNILIAILFEVVNSPLWARSREEGLMGQRAHLKIAWYEVPGRGRPPRHALKGHLKIATNPHL